MPCRSLQVASAILGTPNPVLPRSAPRSFIQLAADAVTTFDEQVPGLSTTGLQLAFPITISGQLTSRVTINCGALQKCGSVQSGATSVVQFPCIAVNTGRPAHSRLPTMRLRVRHVHASPLCELIGPLLRTSVARQVHWISQCFSETSTCPELVASLPLT